jgi:hypothetical protein
MKGKMTMSLSGSTGRVSGNCTCSGGASICTSSGSIIDVDIFSMVSSLLIVSFGAFDYNRMGGLEKSLSDSAV